MSEPGQLIAWGILSLVLPLGWTWRQNRQTKIGTEPSQQEQWLNAAARFFYWVLLPYLALLTGALSPRFLGLKGLENLAVLPLSDGWASLLAGLQKAVTLILLECLADGGSLVKVGLPAVLLLVGLRLGFARLGLGLPASVSSAGEIIFEGLHWAFYRAIFWLITGDLYLGVVWGTIWVLWEGTLVIWMQQDWPAQKQRMLVKGMLLIVTSTLFFYAPNLWLLWPVHGLLAVLMTSPAPAEVKEPVSL
jgi:hypothetical protein